MHHASRFGLSFETPNNRAARDNSVYNTADESIVDIVNNHIPYLQRREDKSVRTSDDAVVHTLIKGDNFPALLALIPEYENSVDIIYIDPPYNTGNKDFVYDNDYVNSDDRFKHSKWLSFMARRLLLARELLSETGVLFVSIDDSEQAYLKVDSSSDADSVDDYEEDDAGTAPERAVRLYERWEELVGTVGGDLARWD